MKELSIDEVIVVAGGMRAVHETIVVTSDGPCSGSSHADPSKCDAEK